MPNHLEDQRGERPAGPRLGPGGGKGGLGVHDAASVPLGPGFSQRFATRAVVGATYNRPVSAVSPLLEGLNDIQAEAVLHTEGPVLIVAGAGSGKTRALTHRIAYLIREHGVSPGAILAITFTNKAGARDGRARRGAARRARRQGMWILTFHSTCARILRREHSAPRPAVELHDLRRRRHRAADRAGAEGPRPRSEAVPAAGDGRGDRPGEGPSGCRPTSSPGEPTTSTRRPSRRSTPRTSARKHAAGALDFDDLISETVRLFRDSPGGPRALPGAVPLPAGRRVPGHEPRAVRAREPAGGAKYRNLCVVGDADQGVYSWRGATIQNLLDFERDYPDAAVFLMEQNYRSHAEHPRGRERADRAQRPAQAEEPVDRDPAAASWPCATAPTTSTRRRSSSPRRSSGLPASEGYRYRDVAVFYRTNAQSRVLEDVFMRAACRTGSSAASASTSARRSRTSSRTCGCS